jgi:hypothetical protein
MSADVIPIQQRGEATGQRSPPRVPVGAPSTTSRVDELRNRVLPPQKLEELRKELPLAVEQRFKQVQQAVPKSVGEAYRQLPYMWRSTLAVDAFIVFPILGLLCLGTPVRLLELHAWVAHALGWVGPAPSLASNSLIFYVQALGCLNFGLAVITGYCWYRNDVGLARAFAAMRLVMACCFLYAAFFGHPSTGVLKGKSSTVYNMAIPWAIHSLFTAFAAFASGPDFWSRILGRERVPDALK